MSLLQCASDGAGVCGEEKRVCDVQGEGKEGMRHRFTSEEARIASLKADHSQAGRNRANALSPSRRSEIASLGGKARKRNYDAMKGSFAR